MIVDMMMSELSLVVEIVIVVKEKGVYVIDVLVFGGDIGVCEVWFLIMIGGDVVVVEVL